MIPYVPARFSPQKRYDYISLRTYELREGKGEQQTRRGGRAEEPTEEAAAQAGGRPGDVECDIEYAGGEFLDPLSLFAFFSLSPPL